MEKINLVANNILLGILVLFQDEIRCVIKLLNLLHVEEPFRYPGSLRA